MNTRLFNLFLLLLLPALLLAAAIVPLNQDEGWYLLAVRRVAQGEGLYTDFTFTQGPVLPFVYQLARPLVAGLGLFGARIFQALLFVLTALLVLLGTRVGAKVLKPRRISMEMVALILLVCLPFHLQFSLTVKTYALAGVFLGAAAFCWLRGPGPRATPSAALFLALAAGTRLTLGVFFIPLGLSLLWQRKSLGDKPWISFAGTGLLALFLIYGPFLWMDFEALKFGLLDFHLARTVDTLWMARIGFGLRQLHHYLPAALLIAFYAFRPQKLPAPEQSLWMGLGLATLLHGLSPFPYDEYQTPLYPLAVLLMVRELSRRVPVEREKPVLTALAVFGLLFGLGSPQIHAWAPVRHDRLWFHARAETDLAQLRRVAKDLQSLLPPEAILFTPDAYLAIESGFEVPRGMEMGPFSLTMDGDRPGVMGAEDIERALAESDAVVFTPYLFISSPRLRPFSEAENLQLRSRIEAQFRWVRTEPDFGQQRLPLEIWVRDRENDLSNSTQFP
ncbi:MAG: hypothetical protein JJU29_13325 [Verrucomicrobia bacterium]|nr:hypothetical protein [Verrucomicrobiota bacterium]MCH8510067.1 hypothetical protein [Kiritimatiellia bacterium]